MPSLWSRALRLEGGQASVELVAAVPFVLLAAAVLWQLALAGQTAWLCANAARVAARAEAVGRSGRDAARSAVPAGLRDGVRVERDRDGRVRVRIPVPILAHAWRAPVSVAATAKLPSGARP